MRYMVWLPLLGNIVLAVGLPALARRLSHRRGYAAVTAAAVLGASCWLWSLVLLAAVLADRLAYLRSSGGLAGAPAGLRTVPLLLTVVAAGTLVTIMIRTGRLGARQARELVHAERLARLPFVGDVIDLPDAVPRACAVGGLTGGRIAITSGLRRCLTEELSRRPSSPTNGPTWPDGTTGTAWWPPGAPRSAPCCTACRGWSSRAANGRLTRRRHSPSVTGGCSPAHWARPLSRPRAPSGDHPGPV